MLNALSGAIHMRPLEAEFVKVDPLLTRRKIGPDERKRQLEGRLTSGDARKMLGDAHHIPDTAALAQRYGVDPQLLERVLRHARAPVITMDEDGTMVGRWHGD